jgi:CDP-glucose 4,6-dehydratase
MGHNLHTSTRHAHSFWLDRPVLVTGCSGFLGSWLTIALVEAGAAVVGLIRDEVPFSYLRRSGYQDRITVVRGDVSDYALVERALNEHEIDTVFHLAAQTIVTIANRAPLSTFETNVKGTWTVLEAARRSPKVTRVVVASSDKAYGAHEELPYTEDASLLGCHPYDVSKACADRLARAYVATYDLPVTVTRCANLNWNRIVPGTMRSVIRGERPIVRSDGTPLRDYLYVQDAVHAYLTLAECMDELALRGVDNADIDRASVDIDRASVDIDRASVDIDRASVDIDRASADIDRASVAFNFGMDDPRSVLEIVQTIIAVSDCPELEPVVLADAPNEIQAQYLDSSRAHRVLGWTPRYSLIEGLRETLGWYREFLER